MKVGDIEMEFPDDGRVVLLPPPFPETQAMYLDALVYFYTADVTEPTYITVAEARERGFPTKFRLTSA